VILVRWPDHLTVVQPGATPTAAIMRLFALANVELTRIRRGDADPDRAQVQLALSCSQSGGFSTWAVDRRQFCSAPPGLASSSVSLRIRSVDISPTVNAKINSKHGVTSDDVFDAALPSSGQAGSKMRNEVAGCSSKGRPAYRITFGQATVGYVGDDCAIELVLISDSEEIVTAPGSTGEATPLRFSQHVNVAQPTFNLPGLRVPKDAAWACHQIVASFLGAGSVRDGALA
jgi:hypothetical protein